ncbi:terminase gpA endonuclease subunit [Azospirillum sp. TSH58]|uniref:terminase gpA endonuclease subunit n=1 Tax=Azospirillum sp. TSH58 TaxID=664962 RepID=UPI000D692EE0|nr:terminase gpA endonuclease subunit [Azospirillum sp. TSH58]
MGDARLGRSAGVLADRLRLSAGRDGRRRGLGRPGRDRPSSAARQHRRQPAADRLRLPARQAGGGAENAVYDFCRRFSRSFARPIKGERYLTGNKWFTTADNDVDSRGRVRKSAGLILHRLNTHEFKSRVFEKITRRKELAGGWHVPEDVDDVYAKQIVSETCRWVGGKPIWDELGANHYLDAEMMQEAAAEILKFRLLPPLPPAPDGAETDEGADVEQPTSVPLVESVQQIVAPPSAPKIRPSSWRTPNMRPRR